MERSSDTSESLQICHAYLLSRQWQDGPTLQLRYWLASDDGPIEVVLNNEQACFFLPQKDVEQALKVLANIRGASPVSLRNLPLKDFSKQLVSALYFDRQRSLFLARDALLAEGFTPLEADISPHDRVLMERFITGGVEVNGVCQVDEKRKCFINPQLKPSIYLPPLKVLSLDIETSMDAKTLYSIGLCLYQWRPKEMDKMNKDEHVVEEKVFLLGTPTENPCVEAFNSERKLMKAFLEWMWNRDPDVVIGWNVINFDLRCLQDHADRMGIPFLFGRGRQKVVWRQSRDNDFHYTAVVPGRAVLDGVDTLKTATIRFENFSLESVANELLGRGKLIHDVDNRGQAITELFKNDRNALVRYNLEDCRLVWDIFQHTNLIALALERANMTGLPLDRVGGSVAAFDFRYLPRLHRAGYVAPMLDPNPDGVGSPGGFVMTSMPGLYENVLVLDFKSLYPSIIRSFKVDPLGLALASEGLEKNTIASGEESDCGDLDAYVPGFNGALFDKQVSLLPELIRDLWSERERAKREQRPALSQAIKILMNSFYGVMGTPGCRFFDPRLPSSVTLRGHAILNETRREIEKRGYSVIYGDTDSLFVWVDRKQPALSMLFDIGKQLAEELNRWWCHTLDRRYRINSYLELEFEACYRRFLMPTTRGSVVGSKKRYAGLQVSLDGQEEMVFKGLEAVRTDWTALARSFQRRLYEMVFRDEDYIPYIRQILDEVREGKHDEQLILRKRLRQHLRHYQRNVPPQVQAARKAETVREQKGLMPRYGRGSWVEYVYTINGPEVAEYRKSAIDHERYIDTQLAPVVDGIVAFHDRSFAAIASPQKALF